MTRRPDLFIVGAAKCGTTSLYHYLSGHPEIYMSPDKEPDYFAPDLVTNTVGEAMRYGEDLERYLSLFNDAGSAKRLGEASARYIFSREAPQLIRDFQPNPYIIAMIRNPVDMIYSMHGQRLAEGKEDIADFQEALGAEADRRQGRRIPRGSKNPLLTIYRDRARFGEQLPRWFETFGRERVHIIVFEDLIRDPATIFRQLLEFLEVDPEYQPESFRAYNPSHAPRSTTLRSLLNAQLPRRVVRGLVPQLVRDRMRRRLVRPVRHLNRKPIKRPPLSPDLRRQLELEFATDVAFTSDLLDRDLSALWFKRRQEVPSGTAEPVVSR